MCVNGQLLGKFQYNYCMVASQGSEVYGSASMYDVDNAGIVDPAAFSNEVNGSNTSPSRNYGSVYYG